MTKNELIQTEMQNSFNVHDHLKNKTIEQLREIVVEDRLPFTTMVINVSGNLNVGNIIRTAHILGCENFFIYGKQGYDGRSCVGADKYMNVIKVDDAQVSVKEVCEIYGLYALFCETGGQNYNDVNWGGDYGIFSSKWNRIPYIRNKKPCIIVGSESSGIPRNIINSVEERMVIGIKQRGVMRSLNVGSAYAIIASYIVNEVWG